ncbi:MAG: hypothetical protein MUC50_19970 [Myxococcota bacterium]|jgi:hypothetical protein|nr:hypothetical protein [Myxococcota bacterium]
MKLRQTIVVLGCLALVACAGRAKESQALSLPPVDDDLMALLPTSVELAAWVDVKSVRVSTMGPLFDSLTQDPQLLPAPRSELLRQTDEVLIGLIAGQGETPDQFVALFKGTFDATAAQQLIAPSNPPNEEVLLRALTKRTMALGSLPLLDAVSALAQRQGASLRSVDRFADFGLHGDALVVRYRKGQAAPKLPPMIDLSSVVQTEDVSGLDAKVRLGQTVSMSLQAQMNTPQAAAKAAKKTSKELRGLRNNMLVVLLDIDFLLRKISVSAQEANLLFSIELDETEAMELGQLVERIEKIRQLLGGAEAPMAN